MHGAEEEGGPDQSEAPDVVRVVEVVGGGGGEGERPVEGGPAGGVVVGGGGARGAGYEAGRGGVSRG